MNNNEVFAEKFDSIFMEILTHFPSWRASLATPDMLIQAKKTWLKAIVVGGVANEIFILKAIQKISNLNEKYLIPPKRFVTLCLEVEMNNHGLPDFEEAFREAMQKCAKQKYQQQLTWSHEVVKIASSRCSQELLSKTEVQSKPKFYLEYELAFKEFKTRLNSDHPQLTRKKTDDNLLAYERYQEQYGEELADYFKDVCEDFGETLNPKVGSVVKSNKTNVRETAIEMCRDLLR